MKIFESGSAATTILKPPVEREKAWQNFIGGVSGCERTVNTNNAFGCLRGADQDALLHGMATALAKSNEIFPWVPTFDDSILPALPSELIQEGHFARLPFIAGTNLDEGERFFHVWEWLTGSISRLSGTAFISENISSTKQIYDFLIANFSSSIVNPLDLEAAAKKILQLYPNNPALGSPFDTGIQTFNLSSQFKRASAIRESFEFFFFAF
jgi:acetylcholinesterase